MRALTMAAAALLITAPGLTQSVVFPARAVSAEGETSVEDFTGGVPWWSVVDTGPGSQHFRMQVITDLASSVQQNFTQISYRRDAAKLAGLSIPGFSVELEVKLSTAATTSKTASTVFANNVGTGQVTVISRKRVALLSQPYTDGFPEPFSYSLLFDQGMGFPYNGAQGSLCMDVTHYTNTLLSPLNLTPLHIPIDAMTSSTEGAKLASGPRCPPPNKWAPPAKLDARMFIETSGVPRPRLRFHAWRNSGEHHSRGFLFISLGLSPVPIPPPYLGFFVPPPPPSCGQIEVSLAQLLTTWVSASDDYGNIQWPTTSGQFIFDLPYRQAQGGAKVYSQEMFLDIHTNQISVTNFVINQVPNWLGESMAYPVQVIHASGPGSHTAATGTLSPGGLGPVTMFQ